MKKLILATFGVALLMTTSCSRDDNGSGSNPTTNGMVPTKIVEKNASGTVINTFTFTYSGNKMIEASNTAKIDGVGTVKFTYTGDKITKYEYIRTGSSNDYVTIDYNSSGKPSKVAGSGYTNIGHYFGDYTYNSDGTVSITRNGSSSVITYNGSNLAKVVTTTSSKTYTANYEYDTNNNNAFKNVTGMEYIRDFGYVSSFYQLPGSAFATKITGEVFGWGNTATTYTATFNSDKLPTKVTDGSGNTYEITY